MRGVRSARQLRSQKRVGRVEGLVVVGLRGQAGRRGVRHTVAAILRRQVVHKLVGRPTLVLVGHDIVYRERVVVGVLVDVLVGVLFEVGRQWRRRLADVVVGQLVLAVVLVVVTLLTSGRLQLRRRLHVL